jgi:hypothetical protein
MALKGKRLRHSSKKTDATEIAEQLAPLEEQDKDAAKRQGAAVNGTNHAAGAIVIDKNDLQLPKGVNEVEEGNNASFVEPVVLVIVIVMLAYIAFIAWQISLMPDK